MAVHHRVHGLTLSGTTGVTTRCTKGGCEPDVGQRMPGAGLARLRRFDRHLAVERGFLSEKALINQRQHVRVAPLWRSEPNTRWAWRLIRTLQVALGWRWTRPQNERRPMASAPRDGN